MKPTADIKRNGDFYYNGWYTPRNYTKAWYEYCKEVDDESLHYKARASARYMLGLMFDKGVQFEGARFEDGTHRLIPDSCHKWEDAEYNKTRAYELYEEAAALGNHKAQFKLGLRAYENEYYKAAYMWFALAKLEYIKESDAVKHRERDILTEALKELEKIMPLPDIYVAQYASEKKKAEIAKNTGGEIKISSITTKAKELAEWRKVNDIRVGDDKKNKKKKKNKVDKNKK